MFALRHSTMAQRAVVRPLVSTAAHTHMLRSRSVFASPKAGPAHAAICKRQLSSWTPLRHQTPYEQHIVHIVMATNVAVFGLWHVADQRLMLDHFTVSLKGLSEYRLHTLFTSSFFHTELFSLLGTLVGLHAFGNNLKIAAGARAFLGLYVVGGAAGAIAQTALQVHRAREYNPFLRTRPWYDKYMVNTVPGSVGTKGSVTAVVTVLMLAFPRMQFYVFAAPMPLMAVGGAYLLFEGYRDEFYNYGPFVGGAATGVLFYARRLLRPR
jgi:membrane associated rhomboid family serine protease